MIPKPVRRYPRPTYPTRLEVASKPGLLQKHQPPNWRRWPEIGSALGLFLAADAARVAEAADAPLSGGNEKQAVAIVAPVFEHGAGRGATGCIVMNPPVFLSEEQALQVIREEMAKARIELEPAGKAISGVRSSNPYGESNVAGFKPDLLDSRAKVAVEFISEQEHGAWEQTETRKEDPNAPGGTSTVTIYDFPARARFVSRRVQNQATDQVRFAAFYDPLADREALAKISENYGATVRALPVEDEQGHEQAYSRYASDLQAAKDRVVAESKRLLRLQVRDFLDWLKAQGAI